MSAKNKYLYREIHDGILAASADEKLKAGDNLPTIRELKVKYGVSETPVRRAFALLQKEGWIQSVRGRGTFLRRDPRRWNGADIAGPDNALWNIYAPFVRTSTRGRLQVNLIDGLPFHREMWKGLVEAFERADPYTEIQLHFQRDSFATFEEEEAEPDVFQLNEQQVAQAAAREWLLPLSGKGCPLERFPERALLPATRGEEVYGLPLTFSLPFQLVHAGILARAGLALPGRDYTWRDFAERVSGLCSARDEGKIPHDTIPAISQDNPFIFLAAYTDTFFDFEQSRFRWESPEVIEFFEELSELGHGRGGIPPDRQVHQRGGPHHLFANGHVALLSMYTLFREMMPGGLPQFARPVSLPLNPKGCTIWTANYLVINRRSIQRGAALALLRFLFTDEARRLVLQSGGYHVFGYDGGPVPYPEIVAIESRALERAIPSSLYGPANHRFVRDVFAPVADQVRDGSFRPQEACSLLRDAYRPERMRGGRSKPVATRAVKESP